MCKYIGGLIHAVCSLVQPQNYDWSTTREIKLVEDGASGDVNDVPLEELREEKLKRAKAWIVRWGLVFTLVIVVIWPVLSLPARKSSPYKSKFILLSYLNLSFD